MLPYRLVALAFACLFFSRQTTWAEEFRIDAVENQQYVVYHGRHVFTRFDPRQYRKPILYPVYGPDQTPMTRNYPMLPGVAGEATDHIHHKSIWFAHGDINGFSFWDEKGLIEVDPASIRTDVDSAKHRGTIVFDASWKGPQGELVCTDTTILTFSEVTVGEVPSLAIDWQTSIHASHGPLKFGDTKEGMMAIRTHPNLQLENNVAAGVTSAQGTAVNSRGEQGKGIWGKPAQWVDYSGEIGGRKVGIALLDHPSNLRHPTTWHAREYGLVAANPFGLSHFQNLPAGAGDHHVAAGESLTFRYRFVFHRGNVDEGHVSQLFEQFAQE